MLSDNRVLILSERGNYELQNSLLNGHLLEDTCVQFHRSEQSDSFKTRLRVSVEFSEGLVGFV